MNKKLRSEITEGKTIYIHPFTMSEYVHSIYNKRPTAFPYTIKSRSKVKISQEAIYDNTVFMLCGIIMGYYKVVVR